MDLEETLAKIVELSPAKSCTLCASELRRRRPLAEHGHDFHEMQRAADRLDHYAHLLRRPPDNELGRNWRRESLEDKPARRLTTSPTVPAGGHRQPGPGLATALL